MVCVVSSCIVDRLTDPMLSLSKDHDGVTIGACMLVSGVTLNIKYNTRMTTCQGGGDCVSGGASDADAMVVQAMMELTLIPPILVMMMMVH